MSGTIGIPQSDTIGIPASPAYVKRVLPRLQIVGTRGQIMGQNSTDAGALRGGGGTNYTHFISRALTTFGREAVADVSLLYTASGNPLPEVDSPNDFTLGAAVELTDAYPFSYPANFGQAPTKVMKPGGFVITDPTPIHVAAGSTAWIRTEGFVTAGQQWMSGFTASNAGERCIENTSTTVLYSTGALATLGGIASVYGYSPLAILGRPERPMPAVVINGDSIADGAGDVSTGDGNGNVGFITRGLSGVNGYSVPWVKLTRASDNAIAQRLKDSYRNRVVLQYGTHLICEHGGNQLSNADAATMFGWLRIIWAGGRSRGMRVCQVKLGPRTTSVDNWATAAGQTGFPTGFEPGGRRDILNGLIDAAYAAGEIDAVIDPNVAWEDPLNRGKWITNGTANYPTTDGTHPSQALHIAGAALVRAWAVGLSA